MSRQGAAASRESLRHARPQVGLIENCGVDDMGWVPAAEDARDVLGRAPAQLDDRPVRTVAMR